MMTVILLVIGAIVITSWLILTPPGLDGKLHAAGYSVCHQIESHSLVIGEKILPLCARCTGTFLGILFTLIYLSSKKKSGGKPSIAKIIILGLFFAVFAVDGINSTLTLLPGISPIYPPDNRLRLFSGLLFGISMGNLVLPLWNQTLWSDWKDEPVLENWRQLIVLMFLAAIAGTLILLDIPIMYYPVAVLSTLTIFIILSMIYALLWCIILKRENSLHQFKDGIRIYIVGTITAILQVGLMDLVRFVITKTW